MASQCHLHDAVPVVSSGNPEQEQEGHAKVLEGGVATQPFAGVEVVAKEREREIWREKHRENESIQVGETIPKRERGEKKKRVQDKLKQLQTAR